MKHHASGGGDESRIITKPAAGSVNVYRDGVEATSGWSVDTTTVQVTADFSFAVPVRFDSDQMEVTIETFQLGTWRQIPVVEIRPRRVSRLLWAATLPGR